MEIRKTFKVYIFLLVLIVALAGCFTLAHQIFKSKEIASYENFYKNEEKIALDVLKPIWHEPNPEVNLNKERINVLVIEGGAAKGLYAVRILDYLEKKTGKPISELYDVMGGTSIGSFIVSALSTEEKGKPKYSAEYFIKIFPKLAQKALYPSWKQVLLSGFGLFSPLINTQEYIDLLRSIYGDIPTSKTLNHLVLYGLNFSTSKIQAFHSRGNSLETADPLLYQLIGGTISFFGLFPPNKVLLSPLYSPQFIGDAALVLNNPVETVMIDLLKMYPDKKFLVTYIVMETKQYPDTVNFPFNLGKLKAERMYGSLTGVAQNQLIRKSMQSLSSVYKFDLLFEIGLKQNMEWREINSFDFSEKNIEKIDDFSKLILRENKEALDSLAIELLKQ
ncbi:MAG: patatin-like phospholipase family protein [Chlamydiia bacterium]